jgi:toxin-antitoxin system PIN domain toxin
MFVVDTNVLLYAANEDAPQHHACASLVRDWRPRREPWFITWGICYEFMRVVTHPRVLELPWSSEAAWRYLQAILASPGLSVLRETERHPDIVGAVLEETPTLRGDLFHDAHTAILMREHGIRRIVTNDSDFHRFRFLEVVDPLTAL